jgi:hypothetical protein
MSQELPSPTPVPLLDQITSLVSEQHLPLRPKLINIDNLRHSLETNGLYLNLTPEALLALNKSQFRGYDSDSRGFAVREALGSHFDEWQQLIAELSKDYRWKIGDDKSRGLKQLTADVIALATRTITSEDFSNRTNRRFWRAFQHEHVDETILNRTFAGIESPLPTMSSFSSKSGVELIHFLIGK